MIQEQIHKIMRLESCTFAPGSYDKRFVGDMSVKDTHEDLTEKQAVYLEKLWYKYRKQLGREKDKKEKYLECLPTPNVLEAIEKLKCKSCYAGQNVRVFGTSAKLTWFKTFAKL